MSLLDVDADAPRRVEGITADGLRALGEVRQRSTDLDKAADEMFEQRERRRQELDEQVRQATRPGTGTPPEEDRPRPKRTLSLGGEEFQQARAEPPRPATSPPSPPPPAEPETRDEPPKPGRTLRLGARDDDTGEPPAPGRTLKPGTRDDEQPEERPVRRPRPPRPEGDDDMSGRTWLRR